MVQHPPSPAAAVNHAAAIRKNKPTCFDLEPQIIYMNPHCNHNLWMPRCDHTQQLQPSRCISTGVQQLPARAIKRPAWREPAPAPYPTSTLPVLLLSSRSRCRTKAYGGMATGALQSCPRPAPCLPASLPACLPAPSDADPRHCLVHPQLQHRADGSQRLPHCYIHLLFFVLGEWLHPHRRMCQPPATLRNVSRQLVAVKNISRTVVHCSRKEGMTGGQPRHVTAWEGPAAAERNMGAWESSNGCSIFSMMLV